MITGMTLEEAYNIIEYGSWGMLNTNNTVVPALCMVVADLAQLNREQRHAAQLEREL